MTSKTRYVRRYEWIVDADRYCDSSFHLYQGTVHVDAVSSNTYVAVYRYTVCQNKLSVKSVNWSTIDLFSAFYFWS